MGIERSHGCNHGKTLAVLLGISDDAARNAFVGAMNIGSYQPIKTERSCTLPCRQARSGTSGKARSAFPLPAHSVIRSSIRGRTTPLQACTMELRRAHR